jgi:hypothetical protein
MELEHSFYSAHQGFMRGILVFNLYQMGSTRGLEATNNQCRPTTTDLGKQIFFFKLCSYRDVHRQIEKRYSRQLGSNEHNYFYADRKVEAL